MNKKILISLSVIGVVAAIAIGGTVAFFSDTETSAGNTFTAGAIDLTIDNTSYLNGVAHPETSWTLKDLTVEKFFDFADLKPGDWGEDTVSVHVDNNPAWACVTFKNLVSADNTCTEPEGKDENKPTPGSCDATGELDDKLIFVFWVDVGKPGVTGCEDAYPGDNLYQGECGDIPLMFGFASDILGGKTYTLADSHENHVGGANGTPLDGHSTYHIGKAWCFGAMIINPDTGAITCNGAFVNNASQSDSLTGDIEFYAVQARNNPDFVCGINGYWRFNEGQGNIAYDSSGNGNHGTIYGATWTDGGNPALSFDGVNDYVEILDNDSLDLTTEFSWSLWVKRNSFGTIQDLLSKNGPQTTGAPTLYFDTNNKVSFVIQNIVVVGSSATAITDTNWHHIVLTKDGTTYKFYIDGTLDNTVTNSNSPIANDRNLGIGAEPPGTTWPFNGIIDEVRVYPRVLNASEISERYNAGN